MRRASLIALVTAAALSACNGEDEGSPEPSGAICPDNSSLTYDNFGSPFFATYCTGCHSSELDGIDRHGAPADHNFDTLAGILSEAEHIDEWAAAGPDAVNTAMPPATADDTPDESERRDLGEWLACGAPE
jgi:uncharacterized membrane protein